MMMMLTIHPSRGLACSRLWRCKRGLSPPLDPVIIIIIVVIVFIIIIIVLINIIFFDISVIKISTPIFTITIILIIIIIIIIIFILSWSLSPPHFLTSRWFSWQEGRHWEGKLRPLRWSERQHSSWWWWGWANWWSWWLWLSQLDITIITNIIIVISKSPEPFLGPTPHSLSPIVTSSPSVSWWWTQKWFRF